MPGRKPTERSVSPLPSPILRTGAGHLLGEQDAQREKDALAASVAAPPGLDVLSGVAP
jgi:hypothetical protein